MSPLRDQLDGIGRTLVRWRVLALALPAFAVVASLLALGALADVLAHFDRPGRSAAFALVALAAAGGAGLIARAAARRFSPVAVSASLERAFPELDNRLINRIQFEDRAAHGLFEKAYLAQPPPALSGLDLTRLRDRRAHRRAWLSFTGSLALLAAPALWSAPAWGNALLRVLNPLSDRPPTLLARVLSVTPGDAVRLQGSAVVLACRAEGRSGQPVALDLIPADGSRTTIKLGALAGGEASFEYTLGALATETRYRFRAGDHASALHTLHPRPPLAFTSVAVDIEPPAYTRLPPRTVDALADESPVPAGSTLRFHAACNQPLASCVVSNMETTAALAPGADPRVAEGRASLTNAAGLTVAAVDADGFAAAAPLALASLPDRPPQIRVLVPLAPVVLGPGASPRIQWEAADDYGLASVVLERIEEAPGVTNRIEVKAWDPEGVSEWTGEWAGDGAAGGTTLVYRLRAFDNRPEAPQVTVAGPIVFQCRTSESALEEAAKAGEESRDSVDALVRMQGENIARTEALARDPERAAPALWKEALGAQEAIRQLGAKLAADPRKPLGALKTILDRLLQDEMPKAVDALARAHDAPAESQAPLAAGALVYENRILEALSRIQGGMPEVQEHRQITGLLAMLDALVTGQRQAKDAAKTLPAGNAAPAALVDRQDALSANTAEFGSACHRESQALKKGDAAFADLLLQVAARSEALQIGADMTRAAEQLENGDMPAAVALQDKALTGLLDLQAMLNAWRVQDAQEKAEELQAAAAEAAAKIEKLRKLQAKIVESMREVDPQGDKSDKAYDELMEEVTAVRTNMAEAVLNIARDLHIFPELPVGNDLVEDVFQIYEAMTQVPGSESAEAKESGLQKEDWILKLLEEAEGRMDDMEMWLTAKPDVRKANTENFDKNELPEVATLPMPTELEDIIGDLLEQEEEQEDKADDSATNQGSADIAAGWDVAEGEFVNFSAKGKSGNERPDHKEQDGRSLVGRQGMSDGETTAGSGKINEGDEEIEARRTRDSAQGGQVQEEDHAEAKATGGGKSSGYAEETGMAGAGPRRDAAMEGSDLGMAAMMRRDAESLYAKASLMHVRTGAIEDAVTAMRRVEEAIAGGRIQQVREYQKQAVAALKRARAELNSGLSAESLPADYTGKTAADQAAGVLDEAPEEYRELVSEYFKSLNRAP